VTITADSFAEIATAPPKPGQYQTGVRSNGWLRFIANGREILDGLMMGAGAGACRERSRKQDLCFRLTERRWVRAIDLAEQVRAASSWTGELGADGRGFSGSRGPSVAPAS